MDKKAFARDVIEEVKKISIVEVATELFGHLTYNSGNFWTYCPFHNDKHIGSFSISKSKNIYKCFSCGEGGTVIDLYKQVKGYKYYTECAIDLALKYGIISKSDYDEYMGDNFSSIDYSNKTINKTIRKVEEDKLVERKNVEYLDFVFRAFKYLCKLKDEHKEYLMNVRGMTEEETKEYFSMPTQNIVDSLVNLISKYRNFKDSDLKGVPGFFYNKEEKKWCNSITEGIGICIKNADGLIEGIQIRRDTVKEGFNRYIWFSSTFVNRIKNFDYGVKSKLAVDVVYPTGLINTKTVFITEGRFKARVLAKEFNAVVLSVQGVGNWKLIKEELLKLTESEIFIKKSAKFKEKNISNLIVAFDADMAYNLQVSRQAVKMVKNLDDLNLNIKFAIWMDEFGKGIDDMILNGYKTMLDSIDKNLFISGVDTIIEESLKISKVTDIKDIPKDLAKELYIKYILIKSKKYKEIYK